MRELPVVQGLMICEYVITDPQMKRRTFVNRFTTHRPDRFPSPPFPFVVVATLTNGFGDIPITLEFLHLESDEFLARYVAVERFSDRLRSHLLINRVPDLIFPVAGTYELTLFADDEPLTSSLLRILTRNWGG